MAIGRDLYATVTNRIIAELEKGTAPWVKPWTSIGGGNAFPYNATTGKAYRGVNVLLLGMLTQAYTVPAFLTFNQAKALGGNVRKGEQGHKIYFFSPIVKTDKATGEESKIFILREYTVFNIGQCDNLPAEKLHINAVKPAIATDEPLPEFTAWVHSTGANVQHNDGDQAFYSPAYDRIVMPQLASFNSAANYSATLAHELVHWSGAKSRLNREFGKRFGDQAYAAEELVAELGAAFACAHFGIDGDLRHGGYIANWLELLKSDSKAIFTAASKAQAAFDFLVGESVNEEMAIAA